MKLTNVSVHRPLCPWEDYRDAESWYSGFHITFAIASSPDRKPVGYAIWDKLQERVYRTRIRDDDHLVERFVEE